MTKNNYSKINTSKHSTKRSRTTSVNALPVRNVKAEVSLVIGAILALLAAIYYAILSLVVVAFNDTGSSANGPISLLILIFAVSTFIQAIVVLKETARVDRYASRLIALFGTLALPLYFIVTLVVTSVISVAQYRILAAGGQISNEAFGWLLSSPYIMGAIFIISLASSVWLWVLICKKDKLVWVRVKSRKK